MWMKRSENCGYMNELGSAPEGHHRLQEQWLDLGTSELTLVWLASVSQEFKSPSLLAAKKKKKAKETVLLQYFLDEVKKKD